MGCLNRKSHPQPFPKREGSLVTTNSEYLLRTATLSQQQKVPPSGDLGGHKHQRIWSFNFRSQFVDSKSAAFADSFAASKENDDSWSGKNPVLCGQFRKFIQFDKYHFHFWERLRNHFNHLGFQNVANRTSFRRKIGQNSIVFSQHQVKFRN
jgi:hypothetical protein